MRTENELHAVGITKKAKPIYEDDHVRLIQEIFISSRGRGIIRYHEGIDKTKTISGYEVTLVWDERAPLLKRLFLRIEKEKENFQKTFQYYSQAESFVVDFLRPKGYPQVGD